MSDSQLKHAGWKAVLRPLVALWCVVAAILCWLSVEKSVPLGYLLIEPAAAAAFPWYTGAISTLGCFIWVGSGAMLLFAASLLQPGRRRVCLLLLGALSIWLGLDDAFMLHETAIPVTLLGFPAEEDTYGFQRLFYALYALTMAAWLAYFRDISRSKDLLVLLLALGWMGLSVGLDVAHEAQWLPKYSRLERDEDYFGLVEDGCKLIGVATWTLYAFLLSRRVVRLERTPAHDV